MNLCLESVSRKIFIRKTMIQIIAIRLILLNQVQKRNHSKFRKVYWVLNSVYVNCLFYYFSRALVQNLYWNYTENPNLIFFSKKRNIELVGGYLQETIYLIPLWFVLYSDAFEIWLGIWLGIRKHLNSHFFRESIKYWSPRYHTGFYQIWKCKELSEYSFHWVRGIKSTL